MLCPARPIAWHQAPVDWTLFHWVQGPPHYTTTSSLTAKPWPALSLSTSPSSNLSSSGFTGTEVSVSLLLLPSPSWFHLLPFLTGLLTSTLFSDHGRMYCSGCKTFLPDLSSGQMKFNLSQANSVIHSMVICWLLTMGCVPSKLLARQKQIQPFSTAPADDGTTL